MLIRRGTAADLESVQRILYDAPEAANWLPDDYDFFVAEAELTVAGFLVWRRTAPDEIEILNLAVCVAFRRMGIAKALLAALPACDVFLEVRESNLSALGLYRSSGFSQVGVRQGYYQNPVEGAIVMRLQP